MKKKIITDFYLEEQNEDIPGGLTEILNLIMKQDVEDRNLNYGESVLRIQECSLDEQGIYEGNFVKIRMYGLPSKASIDGTLAEFDLEDDEGMGEEASFLYDSNLKILAFQRNRYSVTMPTFSNYLKKKTKGKSEIDFLPILTVDTLKKFQKMNSITKFNLKVAGISNPEAFKKSGYAPERVIDLLEEFGAPNMDLTFSMGFAKGSSLKIKPLQRAINQFLKFASGKDDETKSEVTSLIVTGNGSENHQEIIDLIANRLYLEKEIDLNKADRVLPYSTRKIIIKDHFESKENELKRRFHS
ncbi:DUF6731 family protein [Leptospira kanakyensis]|uniref:Uncharacterized protein n=1 Tax=Leptospira kanakyensis TaxID=2484968 RepID=A0A6N4Q6G3_9LEPT|nr:DUF6731 family protein [Leptospira kanakyensis]TGK51125.1 hypothetical protein EHQ11_09005 [Leptospira kanakyensis]TGK70623.1 hypothetical protein EHQ18_09235 [Leptospira kanakyensis]